MMSKFVPRWSEWNSPEIPETQVQTVNLQTHKTCKSASAGFAGAQEEGSELSVSKPDLLTPASKTPGHPDHDLEFDQVESMDLAAFADAGLILQVHSERLGGDVLFVSDNVAESALADASLVVYRASELRKLAVLQPKPRTLRCLHEVKSIFKGVITDVQTGDDHDEHE